MRITPVQRAYILKKTKVVELDPSEASGAGELNIIPFLDIVTNLIIFLLATAAAVLAMAEIDAQLPTGSRMGRRGGVQTERLNLSLTITQNGIIVAGSGGKLAPGCTQTISGKTVTVPRLGANYDWKALTECVAKVKQEFPDETQVIIQADPVIEYQYVVAAMDAVRNKGDQELFPDLMLSAGVR